jgi:hypothetical protein
VLNSRYIYIISYWSINIIKQYISWNIITYSTQLYSKNSLNVTLIVIVNNFKPVCAFKLNSIVTTYIAHIMKHLTKWTSLEYFLNLKHLIWKKKRIWHVIKYSAYFTPKKQCMVNFNICLFLPYTFCLLIRIWTKEIPRYKLCTLFKYTLCLLRNPSFQQKFMFALDNCAYIHSSLLFIQSMIVDRVLFCLFYCGTSLRSYKVANK